MGRVAKRAAKRDSNERDIIDALKAAKCKVWQLDQPVDLLVYRHGKFTLLEVKNKDGRDTMQPEQQAFFDALKGLKAPAFVVYTPEEALEAVGVKWRV